MKKESWKKFWIVTIFSIAMGFLESTIVIYLRKIYYPDGFDFPLKGFIDPNILSIEWIREFFTIVMLITIGLLAGKTLYEKFSYFILSFAIRDIFYYVFLKAFLDWPQSWITWDLLFLIPWPWIGPVLAPLICTVLMIVTYFLAINLIDKNVKLKLNISEWIIIALGVIIVLFTWLYDYGKLIIGGGFTKDFFLLATNAEFIKIIDDFIPASYNWTLFLLGVIISTIGIIKVYLRNKK